MTKSSCCTPASSREKLEKIEVQNTGLKLDIPRVKITGGRAYLGTANAQIKNDGESPLRRKTVRDFYIATTTTTNAQFAQFVNETGYCTDAERYGWSFVFHSEVDPAIGQTEGILGLEWWRRVDGANWRDVRGPGGHKPSDFDDHPVVHVSWNDATAFAKWAGGRLPREAEWEHAARGGLQDVKFPWGDEEPNDHDFFPCNIWQGEFPHHNSGKDGFLSTAPARSFSPNGFGLYNMVGNVWEWTSENFTIKSLKKAVQNRPEIQNGYKLSKGGSHLCHRSYCFRYRIAARTGSSDDSTTTHQGFRVVWDM